MTTDREATTAVRAKRRFSAYAALDRVPAIWGIPLLPCVVVCALSGLVGVTGGAFLGPVGLALALLGAPVLLWLRLLCETDDMKLRVAGLEFLVAVTRRNSVLYGGTYSLAPITYGRSRSAIRAQVRRHLAGHWMPEARNERQGAGSKR